VITGSVKNRIGDSQLTIECLRCYKPREIERSFFTHLCTRSFFVSSLKERNYTYSMYLSTVKVGYNVTHPTYKALAELGKVEKTIYLCESLSSLDLRYEVNEGLNVVERWNATNDFLCYGRQGLFATNSRAQQEISTLCLQLLQNCLMLINTLLVERTIETHHLVGQFSEEDRRALTPLFYEHVNPYGVFALALEQPSFLEAA
jgi:Tn3 transposase DDE domain